MKTLGIAIPVHNDTNLNFTKNEILKALQNSTIRPNKVSLSISGVQDVGQFLNYDFELITTISTEGKNAAQNRNIAASKLDTDIISFMDSDDVPHPQRNEYILRVLSNYPTVAVVHNYKTGYDINSFNNTRYNIDNLEQELFVNAIDDPNSGEVWPAPKDRNLWMPFTNGHVSVLRETFNQVKFEESSASLGKEDSVFNMSLVLKGIKISMISTKLSLYRTNSVYN